MVDCPAVAAGKRSYSPSIIGTYVVKVSSTKHSLDLWMRRASWYMSILDFLMRNFLRTLLTVRCILEGPRQVFLFFLLKMLGNGMVRKWIMGMKEMFEGAESTYERGVKS